LESQQCTSQTSYQSEKKITPKITQRCVEIDIQKYMRVCLLVFLAASLDNTDDLYGVRTSMKRFEECRVITKKHK